MDRDALRAFASRDRASVESSKRVHHASRHRESHGEAGFVVGQWLWEHARRVRPEWPGAREREEDLAHHLALKRNLERAARALACR